MKDIYEGVKKEYDPEKIANELIPKYRHINNLKGKERMIKNTIKAQFGSFDDDLEKKIVELILNK